MYLLRLNIWTCLKFNDNVHGQLSNDTGKHVKKILRKFTKF